MRVALVTFLQARRRGHLQVGREDSPDLLLHAVSPTPTSPHSLYSFVPFTVCLLTGPDLDPG